MTSCRHLKKLGKRIPHESGKGEVAFIWCADCLWESSMFLEYGYELPPTQAREKVMRSALEAIADEDYGWFLGEYQKEPFLNMTEKQIAASALAQAAEKGSGEK
jgi:hypothetical protein